MGASPGSRLYGLLGLLLVSLVLGIWASPSRAQGRTGPLIDVRVERDHEHFSGDRPNYIRLAVIIVDHETQKPPTRSYDVFATGQDESGYQTPSYSCIERASNDPGVPRGVYSCTVIVEHGGSWQFFGVVRQTSIGLAEGTVTPTLAQSTAQFDVEAPTLASVGRTTTKQVKGELKDVLILTTHSAFAVGWGVCVALVAMITFPAGRRRLSAAATHRLEQTLETLWRSMVGTMVLTIATGVYLMLNQTAYATPWSTSSVRRVFRLPYARPYFLSLGAKLLSYLLMGGASLVLARGARRRTLRPLDGLAGTMDTGTEPAGARLSPWDDQPAVGRRSETTRSSATSVLVRSNVRDSVASSAEQEKTARAPMSVRLAGVTLIGGAITIWVCVTLLKYFHEFSEAAKTVAR